MELFSASPQVASMLLCAALLMAPRLYATADGPDYYRVQGVAAHDVLNIRATPTMRAKVVGTAPPQGRFLENLAEFYPPLRSDADTPEWCKVRYEQVVGWVSCRFLYVEDEEIPGFSVNPDHQWCTKNSDCVGIMTQCSCSCGDAVHQQHAAPYRAALEKICHHYQGMMCKVRCPSTAPVCHASGYCRIGY